MGRAFEFRKERKFKRWAKMAVQFTRIGKEIVKMAVLTLTPTHACVPQSRMPRP
jgi:hypothetical protein